MDEAPEDVANRQNLADHDLPPRPSNDQQEQAFFMTPEGTTGTTGMRNS